MKAAVVTHYGGPDVLEIREAPIPRPAPDQVLVRVRAIGLNFADVLGRFGVYPGTPEPPFIPGLEFSGDVVAIGGTVTHFRGGERVMGYSRLGSHAEYVAVAQDYLTTMPAGMSYELGASFLVTNLSAYHGVVRLANTRKGERLLIHAGAGGVGLAVIQLGKHIGAEVFATVGSPEKMELARRHGADHVINYTTHDFEKRIRVLTHRYGVDVVMDSVGGEVFKKSWDLLAQMGRYILYGIAAVSGTGSLSKVKALKVLSFMKPIFPQNLMGANKSIFGFNLGTLRGKEEYFRETATEIQRLYELGVLKPLIGSVFPFDRIVDAHRALQTRNSVGKVVVVVG